MGTAVVYVYGNLIGVRGAVVGVGVGQERYVSR
jgi:hypothetical protein